MSKSLDFCIFAASNPTRSTLSDRNWKNAIEINDTEKFFDIYLNGERHIHVTGRDEEGNKVNLAIDIVFDENADFEYFTSSSCTYDGTIAFKMQLMSECIQSVCCGETYSMNIRKPSTGCTIIYTVGNFVLLDEFGEQFASDDKPWLEQRTTVLLPLKSEIKD